VPGRTLIDFRAKITNQEKEIATLKDEIAKLTRVKNDLDAELKKANATNRDLLDKVKGLEKTIQDKDASISEKNNTISSLNGKNDGMKVMIESTVNEKDKQIKTLIDEKNNMKVTLEGKIQGLESDKSILLESEAKLKQSVADLTSSCATWKEAKEDIEKERNDLAQNLKILEDEMAARDYDLFKKLLKERAGRAAQTMADKPLK